MKDKILQNRLFADKHFVGLCTLLAAMLLLIAFIKPEKFYTSNNIESMLSQFPQFGIMSLGVMIAMLLGGIDLSVVGVANLATIVAALIMKGMITEETPYSQAILIIFLAMLAALAVGIVCGIINGLLISKLNVPAILATLGTFQAYTGLCIVLTHGNIISRLPEEFGDMMGVKTFGFIPMPLTIFVVCVVLVWLLLEKTALGKKIYMIGTNEEAAVFSGLNVSKVIITAYTISAVLAVIGGLVMMGRMNSAKADFGSSYIMQCILLVVLGGVNPSGGFGKISGVVVAILILQVISSVLNMFSQINNFYKLLVWGAVLLLVMVVKAAAASRNEKGKKLFKFKKS